MSVDVQFNVDQALAKLGELVSKHGPQAVDLAAEVVRVNAVGDLVGAGICLVIGGGAAVLVSQLLRKGFAQAKRRSDYLAQEGARYSQAPDDGVGWFASAACVGLPGGGAMAAGIAGLANVWMWVALFNPKLALAHEVLVKFAGLS